MKTMKIKIKHIIFAVIIISLASSARHMIVPRIMYAYASSLEIAGQTEKANAMYRKLGLDHPESSLSVDALYKRCSIQFKGNGDVLAFSNIFDKASSFGIYEYGKIIKSEDLKKVNEDYEVISKYAKKNISYNRLQMAVALMNWFGGNTDYAFELMISANKSDDTLTQGETALYLAIMQMQLGEYEAGEAVLSAMKNNDPELKYYADNIQWNIDELKGKKAIKPTVKLFNERKTLVNLNSISDQNYEMAENSYGTGEISGIVYGADKTLKGVVVGLSKAIITDDGGIGGSTLMEYFTTTKDDGSFKFEKVPQGKYFVVLKAPWFRVKDTQVVFDGTMTKDRYVEILNDDPISVAITFNPAFIAQVTNDGEGVLKITWPSYPGASYYQINAGPMQKANENSKEFYKTTFSASTKDTSYKLDINKYADLSLKFYGYSSLQEPNDSKLILDPECILGAFYQSGKYGLSINAYNEKGQSLASSRRASGNSSSQTFKVTGRKFTKADNLLVERKYPEAIAQYQKQVDENPEDAHSIRMLARIYEIGYIDDGTGKDLNESLKYFKKLHDIAPSEYTWMSMGDVYTDIGDIPQAINIYNKVLELSDIDEKDVYYKLVNAYTYIGEFNKALKYQQQINLIGESTYVSANINIIKILQGEKNAFDSLINTLYLQDETKNKLKAIADSIPAGEFNEFYKIIKEENRAAAYHWLNEAPDSNWKLFYKGILAMTLSTKDEVRLQLEDIIQQLNKTEDGASIANALKTLDGQMRRTLS